MSDPSESKPVQKSAEGSGALLERRYWVDICNPTKTAEELMQDIQLNLHDYAPDLLADFEKTCGQPDMLRKGDEFHIRILGPWNGEVRVVEVQPLAFELVTLEDHPEAGRIRFSLTPHEQLPDALHFEIRSHARSRDGLVAFAYDTLGVGKRMQEVTWRTFCERVAERSGGEKFGDVQVRTITEDDYGDVPDPEAAVREDHSGVVAAHPRTTGDV